MSLLLKQVNKARLKISLVQSFPDVQEQSDGNDVLLAFHDFIQYTPKTALEQGNTLKVFG